MHTGKIRLRAHLHAINGPTPTYANAATGRRRCSISSWHALRTQGLPRSPMYGRNSLELRKIRASACTTTITGRRHQSCSLPRTLNRYKTPCSAPTPTLSFPSKTPRQRDVYTSQDKCLGQAHSFKGKRHASKLSITFRAALAGPVGTGLLSIQWAGMWATENLLAELCY